jgi:hypothetical protein
MRNLSPLSLFSPITDAWRNRIGRWKFKRNRVEFYEELRLDLEAKGLRPAQTLIRRLQTLTTRDRSRKGKVWRIYQLMISKLTHGESLHATIRPFIPQDEYQLIEIADTRGQNGVVRGLELAAMAAESKTKLSGIVNAQVAYPIVVFIGAYILSVLYGGLLYPMLIGTFPLQNWSGFGYAVYSLSTFDAQYWWLSGSVVAALTAFYFWSVRNWRGRLRAKVDALPWLYRNRRDLRASLLLISMAGLFASGMSFQRTLDRLAKAADPWMRWHLDMMRDRLRMMPDKPLRAIDTGLFTDRIMDKIVDAASRDQFEMAIMNLGHDSIERVIAMVRKNAYVTGIVMMLFATLFLGIVGVGGVFSVVGVVMKTMQGLQLGAMH